MFSALRTMINNKFTLKEFQADVLAGLTVGIIALLLSTT